MYACHINTVVVGYKDLLGIENLLFAKSSFNHNPVAIGHKFSGCSYIDYQPQGR